MNWYIKIEEVMLVYCNYYPDNEGTSHFTHKIKEYRFEVYNDYILFVELDLCIYNIDKLKQILENLNEW